MADFEIVRGSDDTLDLVLTDQDDVPYNLDSAEIIFTVKMYLSDLDADALMQKSSILGGIVIDNDAGGLAHILIEEADTLDTPFYRTAYHYDVVIEKGGHREIVSMGRLFVIPSVTDPRVAIP